MSEKDLAPSSSKQSDHSVSIQWSILAIFLGLIAMATLSDVGSFFFVLYGLGGILLVSWVWLSSNVRSLSIKRKFADHAHFGERVPVLIEVHNRGFLPFLWLKIYERLPIELSTPNFFHAVLSLTPKEQFQLEYQLTCNKRGYYHIGPLGFQVGGIWGLFEGKTYFLSPKNLVVYPRIVHLTHLNLPSPKPAGNLQSHQRLIEDPSRNFGVRPYTSGDSLRKIDWRTTAATGQLHVRRFQSSIALDAHLFLNLSHKDYEVRGLFTATEIGITIAASLAAYLSQNRHSVGLTVLASDPIDERDGFIRIPSGKGTAHLMQLLEVLARVERSRSETDFDHRLPLMTANLSWGTIAFVITPTPRELMFDVLLGLRKRGILPVLILTQPGARYQDALAKAKEMGTPCFRIEQIKDLDIWRESISPIIRYPYHTSPIP
jgi:uncharacterized protein (DUF58 family)